MVTRQVRTVTPNNPLERPASRAMASPTVPAPAAQRRVSRRSPTISSLSSRHALCSNEAYVVAQPCTVMSSGLRSPPKPTSSTVGILPSLRRRPFIGSTGTALILVEHRLKIDTVGFAESPKQIRFHERYLCGILGRNLVKPP